MASKAASQAQSFNPAQPVPVDWWTAFGCARLDDLVEVGVRDNPTLASVQASLRQSQALLQAGAGVFLPSVGADASAIRQHASAAAPGLQGHLGTYSLYTLGASVSYALDIFGGERRGVEALKANRDNARYLEAAAYLSLTGNIVNTAIAEAGYRRQAEIVRRVIFDQEQELAIERARVTGGPDAYAQILSIQSSMATNKALVGTIEQQRETADNLLATLEGVSPGGWKGGHVDLSDLRLPAELPLTLPSSLIRQRPDILAAEAQAHAASANIGVATAAMLPQITLSGGYGPESTVTGNLFGPGNAAWSYGAALAAPLFQGGSLFQKRKAAIAAYDEAMASYRATVLSAFAQVADALRALQHDGEIVAADEAATDAADHADRLGRSNEAAGLISAGDVLALDLQLEQAKLQLTQASVQRLQDTVALYAALGGAWWKSKAPGLASADASLRAPARQGVGAP